MTDYFVMADNGLRPLQIPLGALPAYFACIEFLTGLSELEATQQLKRGETIKAPGCIFFASRPLCARTEYEGRKISLEGQLKIKVWIHRQRQGEANEGRLRAHVVQELQNGAGETGRVLGSDLLAGRVYKDIDKAVQECDKRVIKEFKLIDAAEIDYEIDDPVFWL